MIAREVVWMTTTFWSDYVSPAKAQRRKGAKGAKKTLETRQRFAPLRRCGRNFLLIEKFFWVPQERLRRQRPKQNRRFPIILRRMEPCSSSQRRKVFLQNIMQRRHEGQLSLQSGPLVDKILVQELNRPHTDMRCGVNLICRPTIDVVQYIVSIQEYLRIFEPDQYYYPPSDLHLTLLEICHS